MASVRKTARMREIELQDARIRGAALRDIRDIIDELFIDEGDLSGAAEVLQLDTSTLSTWVNGPLRGRIEGRGIHRRLVFDGFELQREVEERLRAGHGEPVAA